VYIVYSEWDLHAVLGQPPVAARLLARLCVGDGEGLEQVSLDGAQQRIVRIAPARLAARALDPPGIGVAAEDGFHQILREPEARMTTEGVAAAVTVTGCGGFRLDHGAIGQRVEIEIAAEEEAAGLVGRGDCGQLNVALVPAVGPIDDVVLAVDLDPEAIARGFGQPALVCCGKGQALPVDEVDLVVDGLGREISLERDRADRRLADQRLEHGLVLVRLALASDSALQREGAAAAVGEAADAG
jgi:hypothetical protein